MTDPRHVRPPFSHGGNANTPAETAARQNYSADTARQIMRARHTPEAIEAAALREMRAWTLIYAYDHRTTPHNVEMSAEARQWDIDHAAGKEAR